MKLKDIVFAYCEDIKYEVKEHTYWIYVVMARRIEDSLEIQRDTPKNYLNEYLADKNLSYSTKKMLKSLINRSLDFAQKSGLFVCESRITLKLNPTKIKKIEALTYEEQKKLERYILDNKKYYHYGIIICLYTGMRIGELLSLKWSDVDLKNGVISINKSTSYIAGKKLVNCPKTISSLRQIPICNNLKQIFLQLKNNGGKYVVCGTKGNVMTKCYEKSFKTLLKKLRIKNYTFHALRHTFASRLVEKSVDVKTVSELMGHNRANITLSTYIHTNDFLKNFAATSTNHLGLITVISLIYSLLVITNS